MGPVNSDKRISSKWWVQPLMTLVIVGAGVAASYGSLQSQVTNIQKVGSEPVQDLQTRVAVLESQFREYNTQNSASHTRIEEGVKKLVELHTKP